MKTIKQLLEAWLDDHNSPFDRGEADNGAKLGVTRIAHREEGMQHGKRYFIKKTGSPDLYDPHESAHRSALSSRVLEHFGVHTNNQRIAHVKLDGESESHPSMISEWNEHLVPPPHPVGNRHTSVPPSDEMTHGQRVDYAKADVLGTAMHLNDAFNIYGTKGSNIKMHRHTGNLHVVDVDEGFNHEHFTNPNPHEPIKLGQDTVNIVNDRAYIREHILRHHPEAYHQALSEIAEIHKNRHQRAALAQHFATHAPHISENHPTGEQVHGVFNTRLAKAMHSFRTVLDKPTRKNFEKHGIFTR